MVTRNFPPLTGGMERLNHQVLLALQEEFDVALCGPEGCGEFAEGAIIAEFAAAPAWRYVIESLFITLKTALKFKPDVIYAGSGLAAHAAALASFVTRAPLVTYLHGLDIIAPDRVYQRIFLPAIRQSHHVIVNSRNTALLARNAGIPDRDVSIIHPGTLLPDIGQREAIRISARKQLELGNRPLLLAAGRLTARKGLVEFIQHGLPEIISRTPEVCLLIVGEPPQGALGTRTRDVLSEIQTLISQRGYERNIRLLGRVDDDTLTSLYFASDLFIFPVLDLPGDVEGFGMVAIEAAAHGLPTIGFAIGGIPDAVAEGVSGHLALAGDYNQLADLIVSQLDNATLRPEHCRQHAEGFTWEHFKTNVRRLIAAQSHRRKVI